MEDHDLMLEEWKERYASYRQYRSQYLTVLSVFSAGWVLAFGLAMQETTSILGRYAILTFMAILVVSLISAHVLALRVVSELGERMNELETDMHFKPFHTTNMLEQALKVTFVGSLLMLVLMAVLICLVGMGVGT